MHKRYQTLLVVLALIALLTACQLAREPEPQDLGAALHGVWRDPITGWVYTFAEDGTYVAKAPPLADGINYIDGQYTLDDEGFVEFGLAQQAPRRPWTFYERTNAWQVVEIDEEHMLLVCGRDRVRLVRPPVEP